MKGIDPKKLFSIANTIEDKNLVVVSFEELASIMLNMKEKAFREVTLSNLIKANLYAIKMINESYGQGINSLGYYDDNFPDTLRHIINEDGKLALESLVYENINFLDTAVGSTCSSLWPVFHRMWLYMASSSCSHDDQ